MYNLPNILTLSRIAVIPFIFISVYISSYGWAMFAAVLFVAASITDYLDGYFARARNETSAFGRLLDPIADKLLVATALVVIMTKTYNSEEYLRHYYIWSTTIIPAFVILCREILVSGLREFLREVNVGLPVTKLAKWKTGFQMTALSMMMFCELSMFWGYLGLLLLWVAAILTFITGYQYYQKSLEYVKAEEAKKVPAIKEVVVKAQHIAKTSKSAEKASETKKAADKSTTKKSTKQKKTTILKKKLNNKTAKKIKA